MEERTARLDRMAAGRWGMREARGADLFRNSGVACVVNLGFCMCVSARNYFSCGGTTCEENDL